MYRDGSASSERLCPQRWLLLVDVPCTTSQFEIRFYAGLRLAHVNHLDGPRTAARDQFRDERDRLTSLGFDPDITAVALVDMRTGQAIDFAESV